MSNFKVQQLQCEGFRVGEPEEVIGCRDAAQAAKSAGEDFIRGLFNHGRSTIDDHLITDVDGTTTWVEVTDSKGVSTHFQVTARVRIEYAVTASEVKPQD